MTVTGGVKFFEPSQNLFKKGTTSIDSRGENSNSILNHSRKNGWVSVGSNDSIKEQVLIELPSPDTINRIILNEHNFKDVTVYIVGPNRILKEDGDFLLLESGDFLLEESAETLVNNRFVAKESLDLILLEQNPADKIKLEQFTEFSGIASDPNLQRTLTATNITTSTTYFEFDPTSVSKILYEVTETQIVNQQKSLKSFISTTEIGTLEGFPQILKNHDRRNRNFRAISGKSIIQKGSETVSCKLSFAGFIGQTDAALIEALFDRDSDFIVWLSGGREGSEFFTTTIRGFTIDDLYLMQLSEGVTFDYINSVFVNPYRTPLPLSQVVG